jgi:hypothetical protein
MTAEEIEEREITHVFYTNFEFLDAAINMLSQ